VAATACSRGEASTSSGPRSGEAGRVPSGKAPPPAIASSNVRLLEWNLGPQPWGEGRAVVVVPTWAGAGARLPVLVALHGQGEALKAPADGAMGWPRDYAMVRAIDRLRAPPLRESDYEGFVDTARMAAANASLAAHPFRGVVVVCPWLPDMRSPSTDDVGPYARYIVGTLLPRVRRETPAQSAPESTGIDGVSLGGVAALRIGLTSPAVFGAVGGIQPAISDARTTDWTLLARAALASHPGMTLRLLTSHDDFFHDAIVSVSQAWRAAGIAHEFADVPGPHDYVFNRGPGSLELLMWYDRVLARD
jgi:iron(III)-salmochelin esterase